MMAYWTTANGQKIPYSALTDTHLRAIIADGYRNGDLAIEAEKRGLQVPERLVDHMDIQQVYMWLGAFASTAIEGNEMSAIMLELWDEDRQRFALELNHMLEARGEATLH